MGVSIKVSDSIFSSPIDREVPHIEKAIGYWLFGGNLTESLRNRAPRGGVDASVVGSPVINDASIELTESNYITSGVTLDTQVGDFTMLCIAMDSAQPDGFCGTWHSSVTDSMIYSPGSVSNTNFAIKATGANIGLSLPATSGQIRFMAGVKSGVNSGTVYVHDGDDMQSNSGTGGFTTQSQNEYWIGPSVGNLVTTQAQTHYANMIFDQALTEQEIQDLYEYFKFKLDRRGVNLL